jgi:hypothetical protein
MVWINVRIKCYRQTGDKYLLFVKSILNDIFIEYGGGPGVSVSRRGQVLPKAFRSMAGTKLLQFLKLRRALPVPQRKTVREREKEYVAKVTAPFNARPIAHGIEGRLRRAASRYVGKPTSLTYSDLVSEGGCVESPRSKGGRTQLLGGFRASSGTVQSWRDCLTRGRIPVRGALPTYRLDSTVSEFERRYPVPDRIAMEVSMVAELGCKVRGVTKSPARILAEGHAHRRRIFPVLCTERNVVTSESIFDPELAVITFNRPLKGDHYVFSADFSDATTSLSHEVLEAFGREFGVPLYLLYKGHRIMGKPVTTGCPMGLPMSWTALSLIHNSICELVDPHYCYRLKGDDLIAFWTPLQIRMYTEIAEHCGLVLNDKTVTHKSYGTFCEGDYMLRPGNRHSVYHLDRLATFSLKSFVKDEPLPYDIAERFVSRGVDPGLLHRMQKAFHKQWIDLCAERSGINPYAPRSFGGLGLYAKDARLDSVTARMVNAANNGTLRYVEEPIIGGPLSRLAVQTSQLVRWSVNGQASKQAVEDAIMHTLAVCAFLDRCGATEKRKAVRTPGKVVRQLRAFRRKFIAARIPTVDVPTTVETAYSVLRRLNPVDPAPLLGQVHAAPVQYDHTWALSQYQSEAWGNHP